MKVVKNLHLSWFPLLDHYFHTLWDVNIRKKDWSNSNSLLWCIVFILAEKLNKKVREILHKNHQKSGQTRLKRLSVSKASQNWWNLQNYVSKMLHDFSLSIYIFSLQWFDSFWDCLSASHRIITYGTEQCVTPALCSVK